MAVLDDAVSPKPGIKPADDTMGTPAAVVREITPPPQADTIQPHPEPVKAEDGVGTAMAQLTPDHVTLALDRRLSAMEVNFQSFNAAYFEHVHQVSVFSKQVEPRLCDLEHEHKTTDIIVREIQDELQEHKVMGQQDITALRREVYRAERQVRADHVQAAQLGPQGGERYSQGGGDDKKAILALKMAGKSPVSLSHFSKIGADPKISRVGMASLAFTAFEAESHTWQGSVYGLDRVDQRPLCNLLRSSLTPDLVTEVLYASLEAAPRLLAADTYAGFKDALLQVLIQLELGTSSHLDFIQKQRQGPCTVTQHITVLRVFTDIIPSTSTFVLHAPILTRFT
jgi:hypothetical protein